MVPLSDFAADDVRADYDFAEKFRSKQALDAIQCLMREATEEEDYKQATDHVVEGMRLAMRVRRMSSCGDRRDFTVRHSRRSGRATELYKLSAGLAKCTHYCYGWVNTFDALREWVLIDMAIFCDLYLQNPIGVQQNHDGRTAFVYWPVYAIPSAIIHHVRVPWEIPKQQKCEDCWENRDKWKIKDGKASCKVCGRFIGRMQ